MRLSRQIQFILIRFGTTLTYELGLRQLSSNYHWSSFICRESYNSNVAQIFLSLKQAVRYNRNNTYPSGHRRLKKVTTSYDQTRRC